MLQGWGLARDLGQIHRDALEEFERVKSAELNQRDLSREDIQFSQVAGGQWDDHAISRRKDRPRYEVNRVALPVAQLIGDQRQSDISIKVRPFGDGADPELAETYNGLIRNISGSSHFGHARDNAAQEMFTGGFGAWRVTTDFTDDKSFDQDILVKTIQDAASSVYFDSNATDPNKRDARRCWVVERMPTSVFRKKWPDALINSLSNIDYVKAYHANWIGDEVVQIAEYWVKEPTTKRIVKLTDGRVVDFAEIEEVEDELAAKGITIEREKTVQSHKVVFYKMSGAEILEGPLEYPGKHIPVVPIYGFNHWLSGKHFWRGMVRFAKDPQRVFNYLTSARVESVALAPIDPFWMTPKQMQGNTAALKVMNTSNAPIQQYNPDPAAPGPPTRTGAPAVQSEMFSQSQQAVEDIQATTGKFAPSLGDNPRNQSGRALVSQQRQGDAGTFPLLDSLAKGVEYTGEIFVDLIPKYYDAERQVRIVAEDGKSDIVTINETVLDEETGDLVLVNDLSIGKYDVVVDVGPSHSTQRQETLELLQAVMSNVPGTAPVILDLVMDQIDSPIAPELTKRMRRFMLQQGFIEPTDEEKQEAEENQPEQQPPTPEEMMQAGQLDKIEVENEKTKAEIAKLDAERAKTVSETIENLAEVKQIQQEMSEMLLTEAGIDIPPGELTRAQVGELLRMNRGADQLAAAQQQQTPTPTPQQTPGFPG